MKHKTSNLKLYVLRYKEVKCETIQSYYFEISYVSLF